MSTAVPVSEKQMALARLPETATLEEIKGELERLAPTERVSAAPDRVEASPEEMARRARFAALIRSWIDAPKEPGDDEAADEFFENMNANRAATGEALPYPPELKGKTW